MLTPNRKCSHLRLPVTGNDRLIPVSSLALRNPIPWSFGAMRSLLVARGRCGVCLFTRRRSSVRDRSVPFAFIDLAWHWRRAFHLGADRVRNSGPGDYEFARRGRTHGNIELTVPLQVFNFTFLGSPHEQYHCTTLAWTSTASAKRFRSASLSLTAYHRTSGATNANLSTGRSMTGRKSRFCGQPGILKMVRPRPAVT